MVDLLSCEAEPFHDVPLRVLQVELRIPQFAKEPSYLPEGFSFGIPSIDAIDNDVEQLR